MLVIRVIPLPQLELELETDKTLYHRDDTIKITVRRRHSFPPLYLLPVEVTLRAITRSGEFPVDKATIKPGETEIVLERPAAAFSIYHTVTLYAENKFFQARSNMVRIVVEDGGPGLPPGLQPQKLRIRIVG